MRLILVGVAILGAAVLVVAATLVASDRAMKDDVVAASTTSSHDASGATGSATMKGTSFAGVAPDNAKELAMAHTPFPATLPRGALHLFTSTALPGLRA